MTFIPQTVLIALIIATAFPAGYLLAYLCRDELASGRKWFKGIAILCGSLVGVLAFVYNNLVVILTLAYIGIVAAISLIKSYDKKAGK